MLSKVKEFLEAERNGVTLGGALVTVLAGYLVDVVEIQDVKEVPYKSLQKTAEEAWKEAKDGSALPSLHADRLAAWVATPSVHSEVGAVTSRLVGGGDGTVTEDEERLFGDAGPTAREKIMLAGDKVRMGLTGARILLLSMAIELGRVPAAGQMGASIYGSDPRLSEMVKAARKAGMQTLSKVLEGGDIAKLGLFFMALVRDYSEQGMIEEAQLITGWWTETQSVCGGSWPVLSKYVRMYLDKYVGRGLPEPVDLVLLNRLGGSGGGGEMATAAADALKMAKDAKARADKAVEEASTLKGQMTTLRNELNRLKSGNPNGGGNPAGGSVFKGTCHVCGEKGHRAKDCPLRAEKKAKEEEDEE